MSINQLLSSKPHPPTIRRKLTLLPSILPILRIELRKDATDRPESLLQTTTCPCILKNKVTRSPDKTQMDINSRKDILNRTRKDIHGKMAIMKDTLNRKDITNTPSPTMKATLSSCSPRKCQEDKTTEALRNDFTRSTVSTTQKKISTRVTRMICSICKKNSKQNSEDATPVPLPTQDKASHRVKELTQELPREESLRFRILPRLLYKIRLDIPWKHPSHVLISSHLLANLTACSENPRRRPEVVIIRGLTHMDFKIISSRLTRERVTYRTWKFS